MRHVRYKYLLVSLIVTLGASAPLYADPANPSLSSTSTVVHSTVDARWELQLLKLEYSSLNDTYFLSYPALSYFYKPNRAIGIVASDLGTSYGEYVSDLSQQVGYADISTQYIAVYHHWETPIAAWYRPYLNAGPAAYKFHATNYIYEVGAANNDPFAAAETIENVTKWTPGLLLEAGMTIGPPRGVVLILGAGLNIFYQPSLVGVQGSCIRGSPAAHMALGYRW